MNAEQVKLRKRLRGKKFIIPPDSKTAMPLGTLKGFIRIHSALKSKAEKDDEAPVVYQTYDVRVDELVTRSNNEVLIALYYVASAPQPEEKDMEWSTAEEVDMGYKI